MRSHWEVHQGHLSQRPDVGVFPEAPAEVEQDCRLMDYNQILPNLFVRAHPGQCRRHRRIEVSGHHRRSQPSERRRFPISRHRLVPPPCPLLRIGHGSSPGSGSGFQRRRSATNCSEAVQIFSELLEGGHTVLVHCSAGVNRSPSVIICYLHWVQGWNLDEAEKEARRCRSCSPVMDVDSIGDEGSQAEAGQPSGINVTSKETMKQPGPYDTDLAYVHDQGFGGFARASAPGLLTLLHDAGIRDGRIVDLGCGSGVWARELVRPRSTISYRIPISFAFGRIL